MATETGTAATPGGTPETRPARLNPRRRYLAFIRIWIGSRTANRRWVRTAMRQLDAKSRRRIVQHAAFNVVRSLNKAAGAPVHHQRDHDEPNALRTERAAAGREAAREPVPAHKRRQNRASPGGNGNDKELARANG